jgi:hypothetical protein
MQSWLNRHQKVQNFLKTSAFFFRFFRFFWNLKNWNFFRILEEKNLTLPGTPLRP